MWKRMIFNHLMDVKNFVFLSLFIGLTFQSISAGEAPGSISHKDIKGTTKPLSSVTMVEPATGKTLTVTADGEGRYIFEAVRFPEGTTVISVTSTDPSGNVVVAQASIEVLVHNYLTVEAQPSVVPEPVQDDEREIEEQSVSGKCVCALPEPQECPEPEKCPPPDDCDVCACEQAQGEASGKRKLISSIRTGYFMPDGNLLDEVELSFGAEVTWDVDDDYNLRLGVDYTKIGVTDGSMLSITRIPLMLLSNPRKNQPMKQVYAGIGLVRNVAHYSDGHFPDVNKWGPALVIGHEINKDLRAEVMYNVLRKYGRDYGGYTLSFSYDNF